MNAEEGGPRGTSKKDAKHSAQKAMPKGSGYGKALFQIIEKRLTSSSTRRAYIPPEQIAQALKMNPDVPLPPAIHEYLCDFLEGKVRKPVVGGRIARKL